MLQHVEPATLGRNLLVYLVGVALAVVGALGLAGVEAVDLPVVVSGALFAAGIVTVVTVHEYLDGPF